MNQLSRPPPGSGFTGGNPQLPLPGGGHIMSSNVPPMVRIRGGPIQQSTLQPGLPFTLGGSRGRTMDGGQALHPRPSTPLYSIPHSSQGALRPPYNTSASASSDAASPNRPMYNHLSPTVPVTPTATQASTQLTPSNYATSSLKTDATPAMALSSQRPPYNYHDDTPSPSLTNFNAPASEVSSGVTPPHYSTSIIINALSRLQVPSVEKGIERPLTNLIDIVSTGPRQLYEKGAEPSSQMLATRLRAEGASTHDDSRKKQLRSEVKTAATIRKERMHFCRVLSLKGLLPLADECLSDRQKSCMAAQTKKRVIEQLISDTCFPLSSSWNNVVQNESQKKFLEKLRLTNVLEYCLPLPLTNREHELTVTGERPMDISGNTTCAEKIFGVDADAYLVQCERATQLLKGKKALRSLFSERPRLAECLSLEALFPVIMRLIANWTLHCITKDEILHKESHRVLNNHEKWFHQRVPIHLFLEDCEAKSQLTEIWKNGNLLEDWSNLQTDHMLSLNGTTEQRNGRVRSEQEIGREKRLGQRFESNNIVQNGTLLKNLFGGLYSSFKRAVEGVETDSSSDESAKGSLPEKCHVTIGEDPWYGPTLISCEGQEFDDFRKLPELRQPCISFICDSKGPLWDAAISQTAPQVPDEQPQTTLWGESMDIISGRVAYKRLVASPIEMEQDQWKSLAEGFVNADTAAEANFQLQLALKAAFSSYELENHLERSLAFNSILLDLNDRKMFFTPAPQVVERQRPSRNRPTKSIPADVSVAGDADDFEEDEISSGSMSDVEDDSAAALLGQAGTVVQTTIAAQETLIAEGSQYNKKMELRKRKQEKEQRIRSALMGLAPQAVAVKSNAMILGDGQAKGGPTESGLTDHPNVLTKLNPVSEYRNLRRKFYNSLSFDRLSISFDEEMTVRNPYAVQARPGLEQRTQLELRHSGPAYQFVGIPARPFLVYINRFHRPEFRWGLYEAHLTAQTAASATVAQSVSSTKGGRAGGASIVLNIGKKLKKPSASALWTRWVVRAPRISNVIRRVKCMETEADGIDKSGDTTNASESPEDLSHPADLINSLEDLSLSDVAPIALIEHSEQTPPLINSIGMVARITKYYRPPNESVTIQQAKKKIKGRLGRFGQLKFVESAIPFFGSQMKLARNQGVVAVQTLLFKAQLFLHPTNPHKRPPEPSPTPSHARYGINRFHDFRGTDFLLVRVCNEVQGVRESYSTYLRPIYLDAGPDYFDDEDEDDGNRAACCVYTVGQTQPSVEVPAPNSKRILEIRRDWLRAYALRLAKQGVVDFSTIKAKCVSKFQNIIEPGVLQKHLMTCRDPSSVVSVLPGQPFSGLQIRVADEDQIRQMCSPESICTLESSIVGNSVLQQAGVAVLRSPDRVATAVQEIDADEAMVREKTNSARRQYKVYETRYKKLCRLVNGNLSQTFQDILAQSKTTSLKSLTFSMTETRRLSPVARLVEEMLLLTPWNLTKECLEVTTRQGGQFSLDGVGDPSGGRGEGLSLIRLQRRDGGPARSSASKATPPPEPKEDLRKLSMAELKDRLIKLGFDDHTVKALPRWDQVALVRRFQCDGNGQGDDSLLLKSGRMPNDAYVKRLNDIFLGQRKALEPDQPAITPSESESSVTEKDKTEGDGEPEEIQNDEGGSQTGSALGSMTKENGRSIKVINNKEDRMSLEAELLSGLEFGSDEDDKDLLENKGRDAAERKALEDLRQSIGRSKAHESSFAKLFMQKFNSDELRLLKTKPIYRMKWTRVYTDPKSGAVKSEKTVYIYGEKNIQLFTEWRKKRATQKRFQDAAGAGGQVGTASRKCRSCGQVGHISSNPICPKYTGPRKLRAGNNLQRPSGSTPPFHSSDEEMGAKGSSKPSSRTGAVDNNNEGSIVHSTVSGSQKSKRGSSTIEGEKASKAMKATTTKDASSSAAASGSRLSSVETGPVSTPKLPTRTTARQRHIMENKGTLGNAVQTFQGSFESALTEMNQILQRVLSKTDREKRKWALFKEKVEDHDAPGYTSIVTNPMWLEKMVEKCKLREYTSTASFIHDVQLIVDSCYAYNPAGHWIRPLVDSLKVFLIEEIEKQGPWLTELDRFIKQHFYERGSTPIAI